MGWWDDVVEPAATDDKGSWWDDNVVKGLQATSPQPQDVTSPEAQAHYNRLLPPPPDMSIKDPEHPLAMTPEQQKYVGGMALGMIAPEPKVADFVPLPSLDDPWPEMALKPLFPKDTWQTEKGQLLYKHSDNRWRDTPEGAPQEDPAINRLLGHMGYYPIDVADDNGFPNMTLRRQLRRDPTIPPPPDVPGAKYPQIGPSGGIVTYHGSPWEFNNFDIGRIGTGEGAQVYGHGIYTADAEDVAKYYRNMARNWGGRYVASDFSVDGVKVPHVGDESFGAHDVADKLDRLIYQLKNDPASPNNDWYKYDFEKKLHSTIEETIPNTRSDLDLKNLGYYYKNFVKDLNDPSRITSGKPPGHMYQVELQTDPKKLLDLDVPLMHQSKEVQSLMPAYAQIPVGIQRLNRGYWGVVDAHGNLLEDLHSTPHSALWSGLQRVEQSDPRLWTGDDLRDYLENMHYRNRALTGEGASSWSSKDSPEQASRMLQEAGVPGSRYLDQFSRDRGPGAQRSRNYVIWNTDIMKIMKKYGLIGAAGVGGGATAADDHGSWWRDNVE